MPEDPNAESIKKLYYSISEVSEMLGVKPHVLRYWETQFGALRPKKSRAGNRMYRERDVEILRQIQELLHVRRYTIAGARRELSRLRTSGGSVPVAEKQGGSQELLESDVDADALQGAAHDDADALGEAGDDFEAVGRSAEKAGSVAESAPVLSGASSHSGESRVSRDADSDPIQTSLAVPRPMVPRAALTELREEIVRLQEWLQQRAKL